MHQPGDLGTPPSSTTAWASTAKYTEILGIRVPVMTIPVKPGRNLAIILEVAAMNNRAEKMGYNAAQELLSSLGVDVSELQGEAIKKDLDI